MNPKKQHEVSNMAAYVHQTCQSTQSDHVLDVGSGLVSNRPITISDLLKNGVIIKERYYLKGAIPSVKKLR